MKMKAIEEAQRAERKARQKRMDAAQRNVVFLGFFLLWADAQQFHIKLK